MKHRTQILLEQHHYDRLRVEARRRGHSLGGVVREAVEAWIRTQDSRPDPLDQIVGLGRGPDGKGSTDHDRILYASIDEGKNDGTRVRGHQRVVRARRQRG